MHLRQQVWCQKPCPPGRRHPRTLAEGGGPASPCSAPDSLPASLGPRGPALGWREPPFASAVHVRHTLRAAHGRQNNCENTLAW